MHIYNFIVGETVENRVREVLEEKLSVILKEMGVDKYSDVLDSEVAECDFTDVYMRSIGHASQVEILMNIWVYDNPYSSCLKSEAVQLIEKYPEYAVSINWCMMLAAYPVFLDMCKLIGKMSEFQDEITLAQLKQKLFDEWGERTTLYHSIDKLISTLKEFDVLRCEKPGKYHINRMTVNNEQVSAFMAYAVMNIDDSGYYSFQELNDSVYLFPFEYHVEKETIVSDDRFSISTFGGEISISLT